MQIFTRVLCKDRNTSCILPKEYNDTILINCTISDFVYDINGTMTGFDFLNTSDLIKITYSTIKPYNFLNADLIFKDDYPDNIDNEPSEKINDLETDIFSDKFNDTETDKYSDNNGGNGDKNKEDENEDKVPINNGGKSSDKSNLLIAVIIAIIATVILILLIIIIICVVRRKLKNKTDNAPVKVADNSNVSNEINMDSGTKSNN